MSDLNELLRNCLKYRRIFVYGDGEVGRLLRIFLHEQGIEIDRFITTNTPKRKILMNVPVNEMLDVEIKDDRVFVIVCMHKKWWNDATEKLKEFSLNNYVIINDDLRNEIENRVQFKDLYEDVEHNINVLLYHRIENINTSYSLIVNPINFENQIRYLCENYNILSCNDDWNGVSEKSVAITFDDGYVDFFTNAYPILKKYNVPATVFVSTRGIDNEREFWWDKLEHIICENNLPNRISTRKNTYSIEDYSNRKVLLLELLDDIRENSFQTRDDEIYNVMKQVNSKIADRPLYRTMNKEELIKLSKDPLITIGAHTVNHILCDIEPLEVQREEIMKSKDILEEIVDREVNLFAYPNGNIGENTRDILNELSFKRAFSCEHACFDNCNRPYDIPRSIVLDWDSKCIERKFRGLWQTSKDI